MTKQKLIGIDASRAALGRRTGTEAYATHLIRELIPLAAEREHRLRLYFNQAPPAELFATGSHVETVVIPFARLWTHIRLARELHQRPTDLFFTPAHVIPLSYRGPAVATVHDLGFHYFPRAHTRFQRFYLRWSTGHNARRSRQLLADSQATRDDLQRFYNVAPERVSVVYPGIDPLLEPVQHPEILQEVQKRFGIKERYLLYLGTIQPRKNIERLVEAYVQSGVQIPLLLAGQAGWLADPILAAIARHQHASQAGQRIQLAGYIAEEDKAALLSGATALLFPSLYEGFGFPILEAQRCHTAVLCANNSSQPEVAGDAALLVDAEDTGAICDGIRRLVDDSALRQKLVKAGEQNVKRFDWKQAATAVMDILEQAAS